MASALKLDKKLQRISSEIRFKPRLPSWQNVPEAAALLEDAYPNWQIPKGKQGDIVLTSPDDKKLLAVKYDRMIYINETSDDASELKKHFALIYPKLVTEPKVEDMRHVGFRHVEIYAIDVTYEEIVAIIFEKFYSGAGVLQKISADTLDDVAFILDGQKNGIQNHVRIGPMVKEEAIKSFDSHFEVDARDLEAECYLSVDIDTYFIETQPRDAIDNLEKLVKENHRIFSEYIGYVSNPDVID